MRQHYSQHHMEGYPDIGMDWHRNGQRPAERWHTDHTNRERPPAATILYGVEIPSAGGGTSVANMRAAYSALPEYERRRRDTLQTVNSLDLHHTDTRPEDFEKFGKPIIHPMVRTHQVHGSRAVYFHITKAHRGRPAGTRLAKSRSAERMSLPAETAEQILNHLGLYLLDLQQMRPMLVDQQVDLFAERSHFEFGLQIDLVVVFGAQAVA